MFKNNKIIICGGGTGGHLFPAMAISDVLYKNGADILYIGSKHGIESTKISKNINAFFLNIKGIHRTLSLSNIIDNFFLPFRLILSIIKSIIIIYKFNPNVVIGTGGYSSGVPLISAIILRKKIIIQEQNSYPGLTNRTLSKFADKVFISYESSKKYFKKNTMFSGNPIRGDFIKTNKNKAKINLNIPENKFTIFICGGSQGSMPINNHIIKNLNFYNNLNAHIIWQCGKKQYENISLLQLNTNIKIYDFINDIDKVYSASDLIISRSGALTLSEINFFGKASILIPFPASAGNHQYKNAIYSKNVNAAILIKQKKLKNGDLESTINDLIKSSDNIIAMEKAAKSISTPDSMNIILNEIKTLLC